MRKINILIVLLTISCIGCHHEPNSEDDITEVKTPVTVTHFSYAPMSESLSLNATSSYQIKNSVKANITGFVGSTLVQIGDYVEKGKPIFILKTKEAEALKNYAGKDSLLQFKGLITITANVSGIITEVNKQQNDYVTEGDQLCVIAQQSSFVFLLNVPFEFNKYANIGTSCNVILPDSTTIPGIIASKLSMVDAISQTQCYVVKVNSARALPENLLATVLLTKSSKSNAQVIDKAAVLCDETMEKFWVMKLINDSTTVRVYVIKGIATSDMIEIITPVFNSTDRILNSGNYGLADTAYVSVN